MKEEEVITILRRLGFRPHQQADIKTVVDNYYHQVRAWFMDRSNDVLRGRGAKRWHEMIWKEAVLIALRDKKMDVAKKVAEAGPWGEQE